MKDVVELRNRKLLIIVTLLLTMIWLHEETYNVRTNVTSLIESVVVESYCVEESSDVLSTIDEVVLKKAAQNVDISLLSGGEVVQKGCDLLTTSCCCLENDVVF